VRRDAAERFIPADGSKLAGALRPGAHGGLQEACLAIHAITERPYFRADVPRSGRVQRRSVDLQDFAGIYRNGETAGVRAIQRARRINNFHKWGQTLFLRFTYISFEISLIYVKRKKRV
jgi:hypothetical protein